MSNTVLVAMSGGVDSSAAAVMLKEQNYSCSGATMKLFDNESNGFISNSAVSVVRCNKIHSSKTCCSLSDTEDARSVCYKLQIPFYVFNFTDLFRQTVIGQFVSSYQQARTPNPCIACNRSLKFERFLQRAEELDYDFIATGHYVRREYDSIADRYLLKKAADVSKDQSYVLYAMTQEQLRRTLFPLGEHQKTEVRELAAKHNLVNAQKRESMDICFIPDGNYADFIEHYTGKHWAEGDFINTEGKKVGTHRGLIRYTIGQRKGLGIADKTPYYVKGFDIPNNVVILCKLEELYSRSLEAADINFIPFDKLDKPMRCSAKIRYRQSGKAARVEQIAEDRFRVEFDEPQKAITPGQAVVLYDGDIVIGGGTIG
jgi:tRNA-specific 2-thiouridylase